MLCQMPNWCPNDAQLIDDSQLTFTHSNHNQLITLLITLFKKITFWVQKTDLQKQQYRSCVCFCCWQNSVCWRGKRRGVRVEDGLKRTATAADLLVKCGYLTKNCFSYKYSTESLSSITKWIRRLLMLRSLWFRSPLFQKIFEAIKSLILTNFRPSYCSTNSSPSKFSCHH